MQKYLVPAAVLAVLMAGVPAEARICPAGQMYRVKLGICQARAGNLKFLHHSVGRVHASPRAHARLKALPPERPPEFAGSTGMEDGVAPAYAPVVSPATPSVSVLSEPASPGESVSPYGVLR